MEDPTLYTAVIEHRRHYIRLKGVNYDKMELRQLLFLPPFELLDSFEQDYATMRAEMIYGDAPDFEDLLNGLKELNMKFASIGHTKNLEEVIQRALQQIETQKLDGDVVQTMVVYTTIPHLSEGPDNITIHFFTEFIKVPSGFVLHRISIVQ